METGHNKNVANLQTATIILTNLGGEYAPPQDLIKLSRTANSADRFANRAR